MPTNLLQQPLEHRLMPINRHCKCSRNDWQHQYMGSGQKDGRPFAGAGNCDDIEQQPKVSAAAPTLFARYNFNCARQTSQLHLESQLTNRSATEAPAAPS
jgi:hypothetical protein